MSENSLLFALLLDRKGSSKALTLEEVESWEPKDGILWLHWDYKSDFTHDWLEDKGDLDPVVLKSITEEETRPRWYKRDNGILIILRGVNLNPESDPEDMVSIRVWIEKSRIISIRHRKIMAVDDIKDLLAGGVGPKNSGEFLTSLTDKLAMRMSVVIEELDNSVDDIENKIVEHRNNNIRMEISEIRKKVITLKRYLSPQREVLLSLQNVKIDWLEEINYAILREVGERLTRFLENLDEIRERCTVAREHLESRLAEQMNKAMYILSIITSVFLPLGLLTGLLGINVGGIPGAENPQAFFNVCILLSVLAVIQIILFRKFHWL